MAGHTKSSRLKRIIINVLFCGWVSLAFHFHELHSNELNPYHKPCQVCASASRIFQAVIPSQEVRIPSKFVWKESLPERQVNKISYYHACSHASRAPPLTESYL